VNGVMWRPALAPKEDTTRLEATETLQRLRFTRGMSALRTSAERRQLPVPYRCSAVVAQQRGHTFNPLTSRSPSRFLFVVLWYEIDPWAPRSRESGSCRGGGGKTAETKRMCGV